MEKTLTLLEKLQCARDALCVVKRMNGGWNHAMTQVIDKALDESGFCDIETAEDAVLPPCDKDKQ